MKQLSLNVDGRAINSEVKPLETDSDVLVPIDQFASAIGAELKHVGSDEVLSLCKNDRCVPIDADSRCEIEGISFVDLHSIGGAIGLSWTSDNETLRVVTDDDVDVNAVVRRIVPTFSLPDMYTGEPISTGSFRGRKTAFFMWASW